MPHRPRSGKGVQLRIAYRRIPFARAWLASRPEKPLPPQRLARAAFPRAARSAMPARMGLERQRALLHPRRPPRAAPHRLRARRRRDASAARPERRRQVHAAPRACRPPPRQRPDRLDGRPAGRDALAEAVGYAGHLDAIKPQLTVAENLAFWAGAPRRRPGRRARRLRSRRASPTVRRICSPPARSAASASRASCSPRAGSGSSTSPPSRSTPPPRRGCSRSSPPTPPPAASRSSPPTRPPAPRRRHADPRAGNRRRRRPRRRPLPRRSWT